MDANIRSSAEKTPLHMARDPALVEVRGEKTAILQSYPCDYDHHETTVLYMLFAGAPIGWGCRECM